MTSISGFFRFLYEFVVGDDWTIAVGVAAAIGASAVVVHRGWAGWWLAPLAVVGLLSWSLWRAARA